MTEYEAMDIFMNVLRPIKSELRMSPLSANGKLIYDENSGRGAEDDIASITMDARSFINDENAWAIFREGETRPLVIASKRAIENLMYRASMPDDEITRAIAE